MHIVPVTHALGQSRWPFAQDPGPGFRRRPAGTLAGRPFCPELLSPPAGAMLPARTVLRHDPPPARCRGCGRARWQSWRRAGLSPAAPAQVRPGSVHGGAAVPWTREERAAPASRAWGESGCGRAPGLPHSRVACPTQVSGPRLHPARRRG